MILDLSIFKINEDILAHTPNETLIEHSLKTYQYYQKITKAKNLENIIDNLIKTIDNKNSNLIKEMFINAIYLHDLGKSNPCFQAKKMKNSKFEQHRNCSDSKHSHRGAEQFIEYYQNKLDTIDDDDEYYRLIFIVYNFAYHISKHHSNLNKIIDYFAKNSKEKEKHPDFNNVKAEVGQYLAHNFEFYILNKLLFSLLLSSDYYATADYMANLTIDEFGTFSAEDKQQLSKIFNEYKNKIANDDGINNLRNEIFVEANNNLLQNINKQIFYLEAPTGSGKTLISINLALQLLNRDDKLNKLFYIFPFNTLVEQTKKVFDDIFKDQIDISVINSITPIQEKNQEDTETNYDQLYINRLFFNSPVVITTHIALFNILFGTTKEDNFPLWQLANSVIILDEIQSYNNQLWWYMVEFFERYAKYLNLKIIIMSATLPKLDQLLNKQSNNFVDLLKHKRDDFFYNPYFKNRVHIDYSLLSKQTNFDELITILESETQKYQKILFEFIKKQTAREFYDLIKDQYDNVYELTGDDNKAYRQLIINKTKENKAIIIIATQVIEAGIDIDMDLGFKDISTLDSEEQFMGRINRSCQKNEINPKVYFFDYDNTSHIYINDNRLAFNLKQDSYQKILQTKDFHNYYTDVLNQIRQSGLRFDNGLNTNYDNFENDITQLNYKEISKRMTLITEQSFTLYFPFQIDISIYQNINEFVNIPTKYLTNNKLDGEKVWNDFLKLNEIKKFTYKEYKKSHLNSLMQFFTFNIIKYGNKNYPCMGEQIRGYFYIADYEEFIEDGKFDRQAYQEKCNCLFL